MPYSLIRRFHEATGGCTDSCDFHRLGSHRTTCCCRPCTTRQLVAAASTDTAAAEPPAAATAAEPTAAELAAAVCSDPPAATQKPAASSQRKRAVADSRDKSGPNAADDDSAVTVVRVAAETVPVKTASFMLQMFQQHGNEHTIIMQAVGAAAYVQALRILARLQQILSEGDSTANRCIVFKPRSVYVQSPSSTGEPPKPINTMRIMVNLAPKSDWAAAAFQPAAPRDAAAAAADAAGAGADTAAATEGTAAESTSSSGSSDKQDVFPTGVRVTDNSSPEGRQEQQRLAKHMLQSLKLQKPAQFTFAGSKARIAAATAAILYAIDSARVQALAGEEPADLCCTVVTQRYTITHTPRSEGDDGQSPPAAAAAAAADAGAAAAAEGAAAVESTAAAAEASEQPSATSNTTTAYRYFVTVQGCKPSKKAVAAVQRAARRKAERDSRGNRGNTQTRPGYVEVREEEWNQLKEQLQVVPHLTEQLQIMTRQHEQLLSLLAAQQGHQQQQQ